MTANITAAFFRSFHSINSRVITLRELAAALSLGSGNIPRNIRTINRQIREAESTFCLAGADALNCEKAIAGTESKLSICRGGSSPGSGLWSNAPKMDTRGLYPL